MKLDIEGAEVEVIPDLISTGSLQHIDVIMAEFHETITKSEKRRAEITKVHQLFNSLGGGTSPNIKTQMLNFDDETYFKTNFTLPNCEASVTGYV